MCSMVVNGNFFIVSFLFAFEPEYSTNDYSVAVKYIYWSTCTSAVEWYLPCFSVLNGVKRGGILSLILFTLYNDNVLGQL